MTNFPACASVRVSKLAISVLTITFLVIVYPSEAQTTDRSTAQDSLEKLGTDFWNWRVVYAPFTGDDVPRLVHPRGMREWSASSVAKRRDDLREFELRLTNFDRAGWSVPKEIDYELLGSAFARVHWELDVNPRWSRDPTFYIEQTLTPILESLDVPGPYNKSQSSEILERIRNIPLILDAAETNISTPPAPFVKAAIDSLFDIRAKLRSMAESLQPVTKLSPQELAKATLLAADSLEGFRAWLEKLLPSCPQKFAIGREAYTFFLHKVALIPYSIEELLAIGQQETARARAFMELEAYRNKDLPMLSLLPSTEAWAKKEADEEAGVRQFLKQHDILTVPDWVQHYKFRATPAYVNALNAFGETDDFTSATRLGESATRYIDAPSSDLDFFWQATARDPRPILIHEGVPGHYFQLALSWTNADPVRRHFYDSTPNEGLAFYSEEMMLQSGLFDDSPRTKEIIYKFMLLRAVGIELDIKMALGEFTIDQAAAFLDKQVGLGLKMASGGATMFASWPGVVMGYQTGKTDILRLLSDARLNQGHSFSLRRFHNFLWQNGNVPIALQRWEYLGLKDDVDRLHRF